MRLHVICTVGDPKTHLVKCPDCGQMELWTEEEMMDHGKCRADPDTCPVCSQLLGERVAPS